MQARSLLRRAWSTPNYSGGTLLDYGYCVKTAPRAGKVTLRTHALLLAAQAPCWARVCAPRALPCYGWG